MAIVRPPYHRAQVPHHAVDRADPWHRAGMAGEAVGWFFGRFAADGGVWCERCEEWFRVERLDEGTPDADRALSDNGDSDSGVTPHEGRETQTP